jgi:hypothetical protein
MPAYRPIDPDRLRGELAGYLAAVPGTIRVAVDGAACAGPDELAASLLEPLRALSRPAVHVRADSFWRDASLRLEYGRTDTHSLLYDWLDVAALRRELLDPLGTGGSGQYLPSLRDPITNRATREPRRDALPGTIALISGQLLLGHGLPFDRIVHLSVSAAARRRRTSAQWAWTLPALERYDEQTDPAALADIDIRLDDPRHPAIRLN